MSSKLRLCLICDDPRIDNAVRLAAPDAEVRVHAPHNVLTTGNVLSATGMALVAQAEEVDAVLVVWQLERAPDLNTVCFHIRRSASTPVLMLTTGGQEDHVAAIAAGGDDALGFPLYLPILQAKILSYQRLAAAARGSRTTGVEDDEPEKADGRFGALRLDRTAHRFFVRDKEVELTPREFALLDYLVDSRERLCTRDDILDRVWGINFDTGTNMVDVYMHFLRRKLEVYGLSTMIQTVRGSGYRLVLPASE